MNPHEQLIEEFYAAFATGNGKTMASCYHNEIIFQDPIFGIIKGPAVADMWNMLIERSKGNLKIEFSEVNAESGSGSARWLATYFLSKTKRVVVNTVFATFEFEDGLIIKHTDHFNLWKWSQQAFGFSGYCLGWTGFLQRKIQREARTALQKYRIT